MRLNRIGKCVFVVDVGADDAIDSDVDATGRSGQLTIASGDTVDIDAWLVHASRIVEYAHSRGIRVGIDTPLEFILKDISTVRYQPQRLWAWADVAMRVVGAAR